MAYYVFVDNSNVFIEGKRVSAVAKGWAMNIWDAIDQHIMDNDYKIDFGRLYNFLCGDDAARAVLYGSRPPANDSLWASAEANGFRVIVYDRNIQNREKKVDVQIAIDIIEAAYTDMQPGQDIVTLVAGDGDYVPLAEKLARRGITFEIAFWDHASNELKGCCNKFISLNPHLEYLRY